MSFIGSLFNDKQGAGFQGTSANITTPSTQAQADQTYNQSQGSYAQQQQLASALQGQNGLGNQSSVYNQLQGVANGTGPNPAQAMLAQSTGANTANQAALMAGQRGAGANSGLMARQIGQQGAANQQNAVGQAASMQANQSLGALGQMGGMANQMAGQQINQTNANQQSAMGMNGQVLGGIQGQNSANVSNQGNLNTTNAGIAAANQKAQAGVASGVINAAGMAMLASGGQVQHYDEGTPPGGAAPVATAAPIQAPTIRKPSAAAKFLSSQQQAVKGGDPMSDAVTNFGSGLGNSLKRLFGGKDTVTTSDSSDPQQQPQVPQYNPYGTPNTGALTGNNYAQPANQMFGVSSGDQLRQPIMEAKGGQIPHMASGGLFNLTGDDSSGGSSSPNPAMLAALMAKGGKVPAMVSPGEIYLKPDQAKAVAQGKKSPMSGERIPGKAAVKGNSLKNDTVPKTLDEGGVVIPRSVLEGPNAHNNAYKFVNSVLAKKSK
jgi:hypothetical protein